MRQFGELGLKKLDQGDNETLGYSADAPGAAATQSQKLAYKLDVEEIKIQAQTDYMADVIQQRNENLKHVEQAMQDMNQIAT